MPTAEFPIELTPYGFTWGPLTVTRAMDCPQGVILLLETPTKGLEVWATPAGRKLVVTEVVSRQKREAEDAPTD